MQLLSCLSDDYPGQLFMRLKGKVIKGTTRILFGDESQAASMCRAKQVSGSALYAETNFSASDLVKLMSMVLNYFHVDAENVIIKYRKAEQEKSPQPISPVPTKTIKPPAQPPIVSPVATGDQQTDFRQWMLNKGMAIGSARVYSYSVAECGRFAVAKQFAAMELYQMQDIAAVQACRDRLMADPEFIEKNRSRSNQLRASMAKYIDFLQERGTSGSNVIPMVTPPQPKPVDPRWKEILEKDFPDGYILGDFICQMQAGMMWQEHFGEACPLEGDAIDQAISACGTVKDGHVFLANEEEGKLLTEIADLVADTLQTYSNVYTAQVYQRYREALASLSIFTEKVMVQQVMQHAAGRFTNAYSYLFMKPGDSAITEVDCERALRKHGGMMTTDEAAEELWFIPRDKVGHYLSVNDEILNLGPGQWMLAEHFPFTRENAEEVARMLDECFLSQEYILSRNIPELLQQHLPSIADNVAGLSSTGLFNIIFYYLKDRFDFSRSIVTPKGKSMSIVSVFKAFAEKNSRFTIAEVSEFAKENSLPVYWDTLYQAAIRINEDEFVSKESIDFSIIAIDDALEKIIDNDYSSIYDISPSLLMILPSCGYPWNGYLLQSYVYLFSQKYQWLNYHFNKNGYYGVMVDRNAEIRTYEDALIRMLADDSSWSTEKDAI